MVIERVEAKGEVGRDHREIGGKNMTTYSKICKYCSNPYTSEVRHQRYCSPECAEKARIVARKRYQGKLERREEYKELS